MLSSAVRLISERLDFYHTGLFFVDPSGEWAVLQAASSEGGRRMLERGHRLRVGAQGIVGDVAARGMPRIALDVGRDAVFFDNPDLPDTHSEMAMPLRSRDVVIGVLDVQSRERGAFTPEDIGVLQTLADQVALAISNARLFSEAQEALATQQRVYAERAMPPGAHFAWQGELVLSNRACWRAEGAWSGRRFRQSKRDR